MAKHFQNVHNSNPEGLMVEDLETIKKNIRDGFAPLRVGCFFPCLSILILYHEIASEIKAF